MRIEPKKIEPVDALLSDAYLAYGNGRLDEARRLYLSRLERDARNPDVLLGLAAIAQQRGETREAAQYFGRVLVLDPRNAAANAGMSALSTDDDYSESRLKILLREQGNSAVLHFALGNLYAGQSRWGEAQQAYFNAYTLEPGNAEYAFNLAVSLDHLGQKKPAAQHYQRAMQLDPSHSAGFDHSRISQRAQELAR
ncbi:tetratricopeptide repeat protein [Candidatus Ferrigenium straubiae]|uniref:tetratricopeptide repeat protein n=1 Tax=Candidatus Ferrigenium straubiae TaxID=2919506 RepID=UPI003F4A89B5